MPYVQVTTRYGGAMSLRLRRTLRYGALAIAALVAAGVLYTMFVYHSLNVFAPPERLESLGRTYLLGNRAPSTLEEIRRRHSDGHREFHTLEHVSDLWPGHPVYQFQNDTIQGRATTSAYLKWGNRYITYSL